MNYFEKCHGLCPWVSTKQIDYHLELLQNAGLINAKSVSGIGNHDIGWVIHGLTWKGHEFVEGAKDSTRYEKAKSMVIGKTGSLMFDLLLQAMIAIGKAQLGI